MNKYALLTKFSTSFWRMGSKEKSLFLSTLFYRWAWKYLTLYMSNSSISVVLYNYIHKSFQCQACNVITLTTISLLQNSDIYPPFEDWFLISEQIEVLLIMAMTLRVRTAPVMPRVYRGSCLLPLAFWKAQAG